MTRVGRRAFLGGGAALVAGATVGARPVAAAAPGATPHPPADTLAFRGAHQAGVTAPPAPAGVVAGLDVRAADRGELIELFRTVSAEIEQVMSGAAYERRSGGFPPLDTGVLGPTPGPTDTSVLLGVGASLFDGRYDLAGARPDGLVDMPRFRNDRMVAPERSGGDLSLAVQAATPDAAMHALRQVLRRTRGDLAVRWMREGYNVVDREAGPGRAPGRNLMGFKDGTSNPDVRDRGAMARHVWIARGDGQPEWAVGGTFQAVRVIRMMVEFWDRTRLSEQERIFGRHRDSGAPLGMGEETDVPAFDGDFGSHIARANPRTRGSERNIILRRPFSYVAGVDENDQLDQGLLFTCYQRSLVDGFVTVQQRLDGEALEEYIRPLGGGFFVVLPGPGDGDDYLGAPLLDG